MEFNFSEDQLLLQQTIREFLEGECTAAFVRSLWETETGRSNDFWKKLAEIGIPGLLIAEEYGGLEMDEVDQALLLEEIGRAAVPGPVIDTTSVGVRLLQEAAPAELCAEWLPKIAAGQSTLAVGAAISPFVSDAHIADLLLMQHGDEVHALPTEAASLVAQASNDPSRRLFSVDWTPSASTKIADGESGRNAWAAAVDRGAYACAAAQLGVGQQLIDMAVAYACTRKQFGVAIGTFQAIKHMLANAKVRVEYARAVVHRAAYSVAHAADSRAVDTSAAKVAASEAATAAAKIALQVHGALGYTWEQDLHVWMRRAWSLELAWGRGSWHRARVADAVIDRKFSATTFGYSAPGA
jgi:alkylation response protein AidB-like acyl-CoA dehydrogenase